MIAPPYLCALCGRPAKKNEGQFDGFQVQCDQCGVYELTRSAVSRIAHLDRRLKMKIGFWTRDQTEFGDVPTVTSSTADFVGTLPEKTVMERAERLLRYAISQQKDLGGRFPLNTARVVGVTHSQSDGDIQALARFLLELGWLYDGFNSGFGQISPQGFMHASEPTASESTSGFIAMWFDKSMNTARLDGLEPAIRGAGYTPVIVSGVEHINKIDDEIISQIRSQDSLSPISLDIAVVYISKPVSQWDLACQSFGLADRMI